MNKCECCGIETTNPKYCSRSCAATVSNRKSPKRPRLKHYCKHCGVEIPRASHKTRRTACDNCRGDIVDWTQVTYGETKAKRKYQIHSRVRDLARVAYKRSGKPLACEECGYDTHVVIHHKKPIGEHSDDTPIAEINSMENLMCLCPNHHWEIHNGCFNKGNAGVAEEAF